MSTVARHLAVMGTSLALAVSAPTRPIALEASEAAVRAVEAAERLLSTWRDASPLARLNAAPPDAPQEVPEELYVVLKRVFEWRERTAGAFDPTVAPLVRVWGIRTGGRLPTPAELHAARLATGVSLFSFEESLPSPVPSSNGSDSGRVLAVVRRDGAAGIDEGAWGKGWALDRAAVAARAAGATSLVLDLGGQVLAWGEERTIGVAHPRDRTRTVVTLRLADASASTSGNSERGHVVTGRRIGHLLDPRTGEPAPDFGSVTVVAPSGLVADILSTAFFVLGPRDGLAASARLRVEGVAHETLFFLEGEEGNGLQVALSPGMRQLVALAPTSLDLDLSHSKKSSKGARP